MLDMEAVRAFTLATDLRSFTRATEAMNSMQSVVSLKIRRLEGALGCQLLEHTLHLMWLSQDGVVFLVVARELVAAHESAFGAFGVERQRLSAGTSHHIIGVELSRLPRQIGLAKPALTLEIHIASSWETLDIFESGALDMTIALRYDNRRTDGEVLMEEPFGWMTAPNFEHRVGDSVRLASQAGTCHIRQMTVVTLEDAGTLWREVLMGGGVTTTGATATAGLAVVALSRRVAPPGIVDMGAALGLPPLPSRSVMLHFRLTDSAAKKALRTFAFTLRAMAER